MVLLLALLFLPLGAGSRTGVSVIVTIPPLAEFVRAVGGQRATVTILLPPGASPHTYEPRPGQLTAARDADVFVAVGSGLETERLWLRALEGSRPMSVNASEGIALVENDPHVWLSLRNAAIMVENMCGAFIRLDPQNRTMYERNRDSYMKELRALDEGIGRELSGVKKILVFHGAWGYLCRDYGIEQLTIEEGGKEPTPARIAEVIDAAKREGIKIVFASPQEDMRYAELIAKETGGRIVVIDPLAENYLENMKKVAETIGR
jgi:zinc transport system substrate-binding protein